ncbi:MAG: CGGC domain-containing protein [Phycisphaerae bacterium]
MVETSRTEYVVIVQCDIVKQRCPGYLCEKNFHNRTGGFADLPAGKGLRMLNMTCSGCCGRALHRKLSLLLKRLARHEDLSARQVLVQFASCITRDNYHAPPCPHKDYLQSLVDRLEIPWREDTVCDETSQSRRTDGLWQGR